jgi:nitrile hydratase accessory protein
MRPPPVATVAAGAADTMTPEMRAALPDLARDGAGPVFNAPWEAQAFAMALTLHERGVFSWMQWAQTLGQVIAEAKERGEPDTGEDYYRHWLTALERIVTGSGLVTAAALAARREQWACAARETPHGQPIVLRHTESAEAPR